MKKSFLMICLCLISIASGFAQTTPTRAQTLRTRYLAGPGSPTVNPDDVNRIWIMAHRGAWDETNPESSLGAFQRAVDLKFEILELDILIASRYDIANGVQVPSKTGANRGEICLTHDVAPDRKGAIGLYDWTGDHNWTSASSPKTYSQLGVNKTSVRLDAILPTSSTGTNSIDGSKRERPTLLKLDGTDSKFTMFHFPFNATVGTNNIFASFSNIVKGNILLNLDKLSDTASFRSVYDLLNANGLLEQSIFKAKGILKFDDIKDKFGDSRDISTLMFTPIFTQWDFCTEKDGKPVSKPGFSDDPTSGKKYTAITELIDDLILAEANGKFVFPGCEIVYESDDVTNNWLAALAKYVKEKGKRVIQFSTVMESKSGGWNAAGGKWSQLVGRQVNYWSWLFNNPTITTNNILPSVFVGDKSLELRSYLNSLGYNQKPIN